jgi:hypothetical protein
MGSPLSFTALGFPPPVCGAAVLGGLEPEEELLGLELRLLDPEDFPFPEPFSAAIP